MSKFQILFVLPAFNIISSGFSTAQSAKNYGAEAENITAKMNLERKGNASFGKRLVADF